MLLYEDSGKILNHPFKVEIFGEPPNIFYKHSRKIRSRALQKPFNHYFELAEKFEISKVNSTSQIQIKFYGQAHVFYFLLRKIHWYFHKDSIIFDCKFTDVEDTYKSDFMINKMATFVQNSTSLGSANAQYLFCTSCSKSDFYANPHSQNLGIDIVIPTRSTPILDLMQCLESLKTDVENKDKIFLVDDNDEPVLTEDLFLHLKLPIFLVRGPQQGVASARNAGAMIGENNLVLFVDSDDYVLPGFIAKQRAFHANHDNVGATGTWLQAFGLHSRIFPQWENISPISIATCLPPAGVLMWKREALKYLNFFDPKYSVGFEDFDLVARATVNRIPILVLDEILYMYRRGHDSLSQSWDHTEEVNLRTEVNLNLQNICEHDFRVMLQLFAEYGISIFQSNPDFLFSKKPFKVLSFVSFLRLISQLFPRKIRKALFSIVRFSIPIFKNNNHLRFKSQIRKITFKLKRNRNIQKIWNKLPNQVKLVLFQKFFKK
jgi:GT2 family glycosyltransferase